MSNVDPRCVNCGRCCKKFVVTLNVFDLKLLVSKLNIPSTSYIMVHKYDKSAQEAPFLLNGEYYSMVLKRRGDSCIFYCGSDGCAIYPVRPTACRAYPLTLDENGNLVYTRDVVCIRKWVPTREEEEIMRRLLELYCVRLNEHAVINRKWNARGGKGTFADYMDFVLKELEGYDDFAGVEL